jgi:hypothetical protein
MVKDCQRCLSKLPPAAGRALAERDFDVNQVVQLRMRVLITGASGYIGQAVIRALSGIDVVIWLAARVEALVIVLSQNIEVIMLEKVPQYAVA